MRRFLPLLLVLAGCSDGPFGPNADESIVIELDDTGGEAILLVGESVTLKAAIAGGPGRSRSITWYSVDPKVAIVHGGGKVQALALGSTRIIASAEGLADTVMLTVLSPPPAGGHCSNGGGLKLARGEAYTTTALSAATLCVQAVETDEQYILVPFNSSRSGTIDVEISAGGITSSPQGSLIPAPPSTSVAGGVAAGPMPSMEADRSRREQEARDLTPLVTGRRPSRGPTLAVTPALLPAIGDFVTLNVNADKSCSSAALRPARVAAVTERALVLHDEANPANGFSDTEYRAIGTNFDVLVYPTITANFGEPTDIDGNGRVIILFTRAVNEMTPRGSEEYIGGIFFSRDLFPRTDTDEMKGCAGSNVGEVLYLMAPDPTGSVNGNARSRYFVSQRATGLIAHETQHLINASRRLRVLGVDNWNEEFWLNEGLSHVAEELTFYRAASLAPRNEISTATLRVGSPALSSFNQLQLTNFLRYVNYLKAPGGASPIHGADLATRGAAWAFLRYAADRRGGDEVSLWRQLVDSNALGYANLGSALGASPSTWLHDWAVSLYSDDFVSPAEAKFTQPSWNFRALLPTLNGVGGSYPLRVDDLRPGDGSETNLDLAPGGAAVVRFSVAPGTRAMLQTTSGGLPPPAELRLTLLRTQ